MKKHIYIFIIILFIAGIFRFWQLGKVPISMSDDETRLTYSAYSIWKTAKDINGHILPFSFIVENYAFNPIPIYITSPFVGLLGLNMFVARLPFAITGILSIGILYILTYFLLKNKIIALLSSFVFVFSAWHLQISRFAYEGGFALFFYLLGITIFMLIKKNKFFLLAIAMLSFFIAFYSYSGTKLIYLPIILILTWHKLRDLNSKQFIMVGVFAILTFFSFWYLSKTQNASSYGGRQFFFQNTKFETAEAVELERRASGAPEFLKRIYHSKFTYWFKIFVNQYSYAFSPQYLFTSQEGSGIFSMWFRGQLYYIEAPLILLGLFYLFQKRRRELLLVILLLVIAPIPSGLGAEPITYTIRSSFMLPWLMILIGSGIYSIALFIKKLNIRILVYLLLLFTYVYLIGGYFNQYYFEWATYGSKFYSKSARDLSTLISKEKENKKLIIVSHADHMSFLHYAFYNGISPTIVQKLYKTNPIYFDNVTFLKDCIELSKNNPRKLIPKNSLYIVDFECPNTKSKTEYKWNPDYVVRSPDNLEEWLVFKN